MTTIADLNDKWAAYAGPGGWNGKTMIWLCTLEPRLGNDSTKLIILYISTLIARP